MGKKTNGSLIDYYLDLAKDAKDFATSKRGHVQLNGSQIWQKNIGWNQH